MMNEELRMQDGRLYAVRNMTSEWAEGHALDVRAFVREALTRNGETERGMNEEQLLTLWEQVLAMPERGNKRLCPFHGGRKATPAETAVWLKACDYWRMGLRNGDTLPVVTPMCRVTRNDDGSWQAVNKGQGDKVQSTKAAEPAAINPEPLTLNPEPIINPEPEVTEPVRNQRPRKSRRQSDKVQGTKAAEPLTLNPKPTFNPRKLLAGAVAAVAAVVSMVFLIEQGMLLPVGLAGAVIGGAIR